MFNSFIKDFNVSVSTRADTLTAYLTYKKGEKHILVPIFSRGATATYNINQRSNTFIRRFINTIYIMKSRDKLLVHIENLSLNNEQKSGSINVEPLFTKVHMGIITEFAYSRSAQHSPELSQDVLRVLLET